MTARVRLFELEIDALDMRQAAAQILAWVGENRPGCRFVVTPNVDHLVILQDNEALRQVYRDADLILADGFPIVVASRLLRRPLPERVAGSELVPHVFASVPADQTLRVFLLGAAPGVAHRAADRIQSRWPRVQVVGTDSPPLGFERDPEQNQRILRLLQTTAPQIVVVGLGAPKQEIWVHQHRDRIPAQVALCVGATIDFLAGAKAQAPVWMRRCGLEWIHRVLTEPHRLAGRYARDGWVFPQLVWREWRSQRQRGRGNRRANGR